jgi:multiple sugar transport system ATP-binding protein
MGIRSEHIGEAGRQKWQRPVEFDGVIEIFEPLGHEIIVYARCGEERILARFEATRLPVMGQTIRLTLDADKIHLFDAQTEQRLG